MREDNGVLLSAVHDGSGGEYLVVINATNMQTIAQVCHARARARWHVKKKNSDAHW